MVDIFHTNVLILCKFIKGLFVLCDFKVHFYTNYLKPAQFLKMRLLAMIGSGISKRSGKRSRK